MDDFLVIGGGVAGLTAAAHLSELGRVTLIEREDALGHHASGRSAALFEEQYGLPSTRALNRASRAHHEAAGVLSPRGLMLIGSPEVADRFAHDMDDMGLEPLDADEARARVPILGPRVDRAGIHEDAFDIDTHELMQGFARTLKANGGRHLTGRGATAIARTASGWRVEAGEAFEARTLVNAAGAWADMVAVMAGLEPLGLTPLRRSMARLKAPGGHDVARWPMLFGPGETWYAKPDAGALLVSPAEEDPVDEPHDAYADDMVLAEGLARYEEWVTEPVTRPVATWAGLRTFAPDRNLVIGPDPVEPAFLWCAGQGGYGMQTSPAAGRLLADRVAGRAPCIEAEFAAMLDPARLRQ